MNHSPLLPFLSGKKQTKWLEKWFAYLFVERHFAGDSRRRPRRSWSLAASVANRPPRRWCVAATSVANRRSPRNYRKRGAVAIRAPRSATAPLPRWPLKRRPPSTTLALKQVTPLASLENDCNWINWWRDTRDGRTSRSVRQRFNSSAINGRN